MHFDDFPWICTNSYILFILNELIILNYIYILLSLTIFYMYLNIFIHLFIYLYIKINVYFIYLYYYLDVAIPPHDSHAERARQSNTITASPIHEWNALKIRLLFREHVHSNNNTKINKLTIFARNVCTFAVSFILIRSSNIGICIVYWCCIYMYCVYCI